MEKGLITMQFVPLRRFFLALAMVVLAAALLPPNPGSAQSGLIEFDPVACCTTPATVGVAWSLNVDISGGVGETENFHITVNENVNWLSYSIVGNRVRFSGTPNRSGTVNFSITAVDTENAGVRNTFSGTLVVDKAPSAVEITAVASTHPDGTTFMAHFPVVVRVHFTGTTVVNPTESIEIHGGSGVDAPSCTVELDLPSRTGECDLIYTTAAGSPFTISARYPGDDHFLASSTVNHPTPVVMNIFSLNPALTAGGMHTCYQNEQGFFSCWGYEDAGFEDQDGNPLTFGPMLTVSAGRYHTCAIQTSGALQCWGDTPQIKQYPTPPEEDESTYIAVSSGNDFACAIDTRGNLYCWGMLPPGIPEQAVGPYSKVSAGDQHVCVLTRANASPVCWGDAAEVDFAPPSGLTGLKAIAAGQYHTCAINNNNQLTCWGDDDMLSPPGGSNFIEVQSGSQYSCARQSATGSLTCWGENVPVGVDESLPVNGFSSGLSHTCAWKQNSPKNHLVCWGWNYYGQAPRLSLLPAALSDEVSYIPLGDTWRQEFTYGGGYEPHTLTLGAGAPSSMTLNGGAVTWTPANTGSVNFSLTITENSTASSLPLELYPVTRTYPLYVQSPVTTISVSPASSTADAGSPVIMTTTVTKEGGVVPLVSGTVTITSVDGLHTNTCLAPVQSTATGGTASCTLYFANSGLHTIQAAYSGNHFFTSSSSSGGQNGSVTIQPVTVTPVVSAGSQFTCSLSGTGQPTCWGKSSNGQTTPIPGIYNQISTGDSYACARSLNASIYCWGWDAHGLDQPVTGTNFAQVTTGSTHACALSTDGTVISCWGNTTDGRTTTPASGPTYLMISAGNDHTCALKHEFTDSNGTKYGTVACWGVNTNGQTSAPGSYFTSISSGGTFTCGILYPGGGLSCWGDSTSGKTTPPSSVFDSVDAGNAHACAVRKNDNDSDPADGDDTVVCWGDAAGGKTAAPAHTFRSVSAGLDHTCGIRKTSATLTNDILECWGSNTQDQAPFVTISPVGLDTVSVGAFVEIQIAADGGRTQAFTYSTHPEQPAGLEIQSGTGLINGTPPNAGAYDFTVRAIEGQYSPAFMAEANYHLIVRSQASVQIQSVSPAERMVGKPVAVQVQVAETPGGFFTATPPTGTVTVQSSDGMSCQAALIAGVGVSTGTCTLFFTEDGAKDLSASYPGDAHFLNSGTSAPLAIDVAAFVQAPRVHTSAQQTYAHFADGSIECMGAGCVKGGLVGLQTRLSISTTQACGLGLDGNVRCRDGILPSTFAAAVLSHGPYKDLAVGAAHACAIRLDDTVFCWGDSADGKTSPPAGAFASVSAGETQTCGIRTTGELACWGLGAAAPPGAYTQVSVGTAHSCAVSSENGLACWGSSIPGPVPSAGVFQMVSVGDAHTCALNQAGQILCWGENAAEQSSAPYGIFTTLDSAADHNCALRAGPQLTCWGANTNGEAPQIRVNDLMTTELVANQYWEFAFNPDGGNRPYQASKASGQLPQGIEMEVNLSEAGVILYGTPYVPGDYSFVLRWEDDTAGADAPRSIPLVLEKAYSLRVTGADLLVSITPAGSTAMAYNRFSFTYTFRNLTVLPVPSVRIAIEIAPQLEDIILTGLDGCTQAEATLTCDLALLDPGAGETLVLDGYVAARNGESITTGVEIQPRLANWPELVPADNTASLTIPVANQTVIFNDTFDCETRGVAWAAGECLSAPSGVTYLGDFTGATTLNLHVAPLAPHKWVEVSLDLVVIGPWLGNNAADPPNPSLWSMGQPGQPALLTTTFCNDPSCTQAYPGGYPDGNYPGQTHALGTNALNYPDTADSRYRITLRFPHTASALDLVLASAGLPAGASWGIDNVQVTIGSGISVVYMPVLSK